MTIRSAFLPAQPMPSIDDVERTVAAPAETSDPFEILARREIEFGFNLHGVEIDIEIRIRFGFMPDD